LVGRGLGARLGSCRRIVCFVVAGLWRAFGHVDSDERGTFMAFRRRGSVGMESSGWAGDVKGVNVKRPRESIAVAALGALGARPSATSELVDPWRQLSTQPLQGLGKLEPIRACPSIMGPQPYQPVAPERAFHRQGASEKHFENAAKFDLELLGARQANRQIPCSFPTFRSTWPRPIVSQRHHFPGS
jgi:hypothetical protein